MNLSPVESFQKLLDYQLDLESHRELVSGALWASIRSEEEDNWRDYCFEEDMKKFDELIPVLINGTKGPVHVNLRVQAKEGMTRVWEFELWYEKEKKQVRGKGFDVTKYIEKEKDMGFLENAYSLIQEQEKLKLELANPLTVLNLSLRDFEPYRDRDPRLEESFARIERSLKGINTVLASFSEAAISKKAGNFLLLDLIEELQRNYPELQHIVYENTENKIASNFWTLFFCIEKVLKIFKSRMVIPLLKITSGDGKVSLGFYENLVQAGISRSANIPSINYCFLKKDEQQKFNLCKFTLKRTFGSLLLESTAPLSIRLEVPVVK